MRGGRRDNYFRYVHLYEIERKDVWRTVYLDGIQIYTTQDDRKELSRAVVPTKIPN